MQKLQGKHWELYEGSEIGSASLLALVVRRGGSVEVLTNSHLETDPETLAAELRGST